MEFDWYHRLGVDPWQMAACAAHGTQLAEFGFQRGLLPRYADLGAASKCALCTGTTSLDDVRACRCNVLGGACPVHRPAPAGGVGEWVRVRCMKCGAELQLPAERISFEETDTGCVAVDVTGWARRNGASDELRCPFHGASVYYLELVWDAAGEDLVDVAELDPLDDRDADPNAGDAPTTPRDREHDDRD